MIEEILQDSSLRVFNVDRDCYVIFIGADQNAHRAFLRLGHSALLPRAVHSCIEGLVCTRDLLGDIVAERDLLMSLTPRERPYFVGVPTVLKHYKSFFALKKAFGAKYQLVQKSSALKERGTFLYYTNIDQIDVVLNSERIFSLRKRAARDLHFSQRNMRIGRLISQYNSAYNASNLPSSGFFVVDSALYVCDHGQMFAVDPPAHCYARLAELGFDARMISGGLHTKPDYSFLSLIMNNTLRNPPAEWHFHYPDSKVAGAVDTDLFLQFAGKKIATNVTTGSLDLPFSSFALTRWSDSQRQESAPLAEARASSAYALRFDDQHCQCVIDTEEHVWRIIKDDTSWEGELIPNIPYSFSLDQPVAYEVFARLYLPDAFQSSTHTLTRSETFLLNACIRFFNSQTVKKLRENYQQLKRARKGVPRSAQLLTLYALRNICTLLQLQCEKYADDPTRLPWLQKALNQISKTIARLSPLTKHTLYLPAQAVIHSTMSGEFVQFIQYNWNRDHRYATHELGIQQQVSAVTAGAGGEFYQAERARLFGLLADLNGEDEEIQSLAKGLGRKKDQQETQAHQGKKVAATIDKKLAVTIDKKLAVTIDKKLAVTTGKKLAVTTGKKLAVTTGIEIRSVRRVGAIILAAVAVVAVALVLILIISNSSGDRAGRERGSQQSASTGDVQGATTSTTSTATSTADAPVLDAIEARIVSSALDEGVFVSTIDTGATLLSDVHLTVRSPLGSVEVTIAEIIRVVNTIARQSGFREIGAEDIAIGDDPDLIYPFGQLSFPLENQKYRIIEDDSLWLVSISLIESQIKDFISRLVEIDGIINSGVPDPATAGLLRDSIDIIVNESYNESLAEIARDIRGKL